MELLIHCQNLKDAKILDKQTKISPVNCKIIVRADLSAWHEILEEQNCPGVGTRFNILLPLPKKINELPKCQTFFRGCHFEFEIQVL